LQKLPKFYEFCFSLREIQIYSLKLRHAFVYLFGAKIESTKISLLLGARVHTIRESPTLET